MVNPTNERDKADPKQISAIRNMFIQHPAAFGILLTTAGGLSAPLFEAAGATLITAMLFSALFDVICMGAEHLLDHAVTLKENKIMAELDDEVYHLKLYIGNSIRHPESPLALPHGRDKTYGPNADSLTKFPCFEVLEKTRVRSKSQINYVINTGESKTVPLDTTLYSLYPGDIILVEDSTLDNNILRLNFKFFKRDSHYYANKADPLYDSRSQKTKMITSLMQHPDDLKKELLIIERKHELMKLNKDKLIDICRYYKKKSKSMKRETSDISDDLDLSHTAVADGGLVPHPPVSNEGGRWTKMFTKSKILQNIIDYEEGCIQNKNISFINFNTTKIKMKKKNIGRNRRRSRQGELGRVLSPTTSIESVGSLSRGSSAASNTSSEASSGGEENKYYAAHYISDSIFNIYKEIESSTDEGVLLSKLSNIFKYNELKKLVEGLDGHDESEDDNFSQEIIDWFNRNKEMLIREFDGINVRSGEECGKTSECITKVIAVDDNLSNALGGHVWNKIKLLWGHQNSCLGENTGEDNSYCLESLMIKIKSTMNLPSSDISITEINSLFGIEGDIGKIFKEIHASAQERGFHVPGWCTFINSVGKRMLRPASHQTLNEFNAFHQQVQENEASYEPIHEAFTEKIGNSIDRNFKNKAHIINKVVNVWRRPSTNRKVQESAVRWTETTNKSKIKKELQTGSDRTIEGELKDTSGAMVSLSGQYNVGYGEVNTTLSRGDETRIIINTEALINHIYRTSRPAGGKRHTSKKNKRTKRTKRKRTKRRTNRK